MGDAGPGPGDRLHEPLLEVPRCAGTHRRHGPHRPRCRSRRPDGAGSRVAGSDHGGARRARGHGPRRPRHGGGRDGPPGVRRRVGPDARRCCRSPTRSTGQTPSSWWRPGSSARTTTATRWHVTSRCTATVWCSPTRSPPTCVAPCSTPRAGQRAGTARTPTSSCARAVPACGSSGCWPPGCPQMPSVEAAFRAGTGTVPGRRGGGRRDLDRPLPALSGRHLRRSRRRARGAGPGARGGRGSRVERPHRAARALGRRPGRRRGVRPGLVASALHPPAGVRGGCRAPCSGPSGPTAGSSCR